MEVLSNTILAIVLIFGLSSIPGLALTRIIDKDCGLRRYLLLNPVLGIFILLALAGLSVLLSGGFSPILLLILVIISNVFAFRYILNAKIMLSSNSNQSNEILLKIAIALILLCSLLPLFLFRVPNGVDWIGFATLTQLYSSTGVAELSHPISVSWTYPPAFPALAAWLQLILDVPASDAVHLLGRLTLLAVILGIGGIAEKWNAAAMTLVATALGFGLFVKAHDSGYPTIAAQAGVIIGIVMTLQNTHKSRLHHALLALVVLLTGLIHPTGSTYLVLLIVASMIFRFRLSKQRDDDALIAVIATISVATFVTLYFFSSKMEGLPIHAEYGWQGGIAMILYNNPLLLALGIWSSWKYKDSMEGGVLGLWLLLLWLLTFLHLLSGFKVLEILTLFSYVLYSMALHAFHIPLALLAGILLSKNAQLNLNEMESEFSIPEWIPRTSIAFCLCFLIIGQSAIIVLSNHQEVLVHSEGDESILAHLGALPSGTVVYTEQAHWGFIIDSPEHVHFTSHPILGIMDDNSDLQDRATSAIRADDGVALKEMGVKYALTSPMSLLGATLVESKWWRPMAVEDGARLWSMGSHPASGQRGMVSTPSEDDCGKGCEWRLEPWREHRWWNHPGLSDHRAFVTEGAIEWTTILPDEMSIHGGTLELYFDAPEGLQIKFILEGGVEMNQITTKGGWQTLVLETSPFGKQVNLSVEVNGGGGLWLNPTGLSGRGDHLFDECGVRIHWVEVREFGMMEAPT